MPFPILIGTTLTTVLHYHADCDSLHPIIYILASMSYFYSCIYVCYVILYSTYLLTYGNLPYIISVDCMNTLDAITMVTMERQMRVGNPIFAVCPADISYFL